MMNDFMNLVNKRFSARRYIDRPVERDKIERCIEAARLAPSACNSQPWFFHIIDDKEMLKAIYGFIAGSIVPINRFIHNAPVIIAVVTDKANVLSTVGSKVKNREYRYIDTGIAAEHICLKAVEEGLGTCMIGWFDSKGIKKLLKSNKDIDLLITMGYTDEQPVEKKRKELSSIMQYNLESK